VFRAGIDGRLVDLTPGLRQEISRAEWDGTRTDYGPPQGALARVAHQAGRRDADFAMNRCAIPSMARAVAVLGQSASSRAKPWNKHTWSCGAAEPRSSGQREAGTFELTWRAWPAMKPRLVPFTCNWQVR